jgi:hypothetical protein
MAGIIKGAMGQKMISMGDNTYNMNITKPPKSTIKTRLHVYAYVLQC